MKRGREKEKERKRSGKEGKLRKFCSGESVKTVFAHCDLSVNMPISERGLSHA